jgi:hypothetical protein
MVMVYVPDCGVGSLRLYASRSFDRRCRNRPMSGGRLPSSRVDEMGATAIVLFLNGLVGSVGCCPGSKHDGQRQPTVLLTSGS